MTYGDESCSHEWIVWNDLGVLREGDELDEKEARILLKPGYDTDGGERYAECSECGAVIHSQFGEVVIPKGD